MQAYIKQGKPNINFENHAYTPVFNVVLNTQLNSDNNSLKTEYRTDASYINSACALHRQNNVLPTQNTNC